MDCERAAHAAMARQSDGNVEGWARPATLTIQNVCWILRGGLWLRGGLKEGRKHTDARGRCAHRPLGVWILQLNSCGS